jgi:nitroreductase
MKTHKLAMSTMDAIYARRSVRAYSDTALDRKTIQALLAAAVQAPTAIHEEPWAFSVIQDQEILARLSDSAKTIYHKEIHIAPTEHASVVPHGMEDPNASLFHDAGTLVVIWAKPLGSYAAADCWLPRI